MPHSAPKFLISDSRRVSSELPGQGGRRVVGGSERERVATGSSPFPDRNRARGDFDKH